MTSENKDLKYIFIFGIASILLFFVFQFITLIILFLVVMVIYYKYRKIKPILVGNFILAFLTFSFFILGVGISFVWAYISFYLWILLLGIIASLYGIAAIKVSKHFGIPTSEKLSNISPALIAFLEIVYPGVGFTYLGKQKGKNYIIVGIAIFSFYLITGIIFALNSAVIPDIIFYFYNFIYRVITPIVAYTTVKKIKG